MAAFQFSSNTVVEQPVDKNVINPGNLASCSIDDRGEAIIKEGICDHTALKIEVANHLGCTTGLALGALGILPLICWCAICYPLGCYCGRKIADSWRLHLTQSMIHHKRAIPGSCRKGIDIRLDLADISSISVENTTVDEGYGPLALCHKIVPTSIKLKLKPGKRQDLIPPWYSGGCIHICINLWQRSHGVVVLIRHCANAEEFVEAVKRQMTSM